MAAPVKSYTKKELRNMYGISRRVLNKWLSEVPGMDNGKVKNRQLLTPLEVQQIFAVLGEP